MEEKGITHLIELDFTNYHDPMHKKFGALSSSVDPNQLSLTVTATIRSVLSILVAFGYVNTVQMDTTLLQVPVIVMAGYAAWQAVEAVWGAVRKLINLFANTE